jgi:hypothetical protein
MASSCLDHQRQILKLVSQRDPTALNVQKYGGPASRNSLILAKDFVFGSIGSALFDGGHSGCSPGGLIQQTATSASSIGVRFCSIDRCA